jgi:hypothetical protein
MTIATRCDACGAPRTEGISACPYCKKVYPDAAGVGGAGPRPAGIPPGILEALDAENRIEAIRLYRAATKASLSEAKKVIEDLVESRKRRR